jgi:TRAP-type transport system large permease protein
MLAVIALAAYIAVIVLWVAVLKRNIGEALLVGLVVIALFGGAQAPQLILDGVTFAATEQVVFAALAFVFMAYILSRTGLIDHLVNLLNSVLGRLPGGAGYVDTVASAAFGAISGSGSGNTAAVGSITIPWMRRSHWPPTVATTVVAGNAGLGIALPPSSSLFILVGIGAVTVSANDLFLALAVGGLWTFLYRMILVTWFVRRHSISPVDRHDIMPLRQAVRLSWTTLVVFAGILIPVLLTAGPGADMLEGGIGADAADEISVIVWIPVLVLLLALLMGFRRLPRTVSGWWGLFGDVAPRYAVIGPTLFFAFAASEVLTNLGLPEQLGALLDRVDAPGIVMATVVGLLVVLVAAPLTATATTAAIGGVAFTALVSAGLDPVPAAVAILIFASTEGASPPGAAPIFIASGISGINPARTFVPLIVYYVIPILLIGILVALGVLPVFG